MDLYYEIDSPSCLSVIVTAAALNINLNLKKMSLMVEKNHLTPEYTKLNPQQTIPTLVDNGFALAESRAINIYLAEKYGKDDSLYPKDHKIRSVINQRLFFDMGSLETHLLNYFLHWFYGKPQDSQDLKKFEKALVALNTFLEENNYVLLELKLLPLLTFQCTQHFWHFLT
ncbi:CLUMA_CG020091, isoform A [Clunio marinus]|uniref:glutathione transferase n=1 Tax=Clunio marinus TaxID=568069 RepID=A0A1J1J5M1_9DIPT|nr:CLUMA_CG020091, isoform A [Clunio marinus]